MDGAEAAAETEGGEMREECGGGGSGVGEDGEKAEVWCLCCYHFCG